MSASRPRWWLRKAIRGAAARAAWSCGWVAARERLAPGPRVRAITYHRFGDVARDPWVVRTDDFDAQMRWLAEQGLAVSIDELLEFVAGRRALADGAVLVTIDDGCLSTLTDALPVLRRYGIPAVAFVSAGLIGSRAAAPDHGESNLDWDELSALHTAGVEIASHAFNHRSLGRLALAEARDEALRSRTLLEERLGVPVRAFGYPFGMTSDFSPATHRMLSEVGYALAFNSVHGAIRRDSNPFDLPRVKIEAGEGMAMFRLSCCGAMDAWRVIDESLGRLRTVRPELPALNTSGLGATGPIPFTVAGDRPDRGREPPGRNPSDGGD